MRHGTAMAGAIAARRNGEGIVGVAPDARLLSLGACRQAQAGAAAALCDTVGLAIAIDAAIQERAEVIVMSLGGGPEDPLLSRLVAAAIHRGSVVVAAGNWRDPRSVGFPHVPGVLVAQEPAPAGAIVPLRDPETAPLGSPGNGILTSVPPSIWDYLKGDSLSAAHAAGVVALIKERAPKMTPAEIALLLRSTAQPRIGLAPEMGTGIIDACAAVASLAGAACPP
jgi:subtilisin family serine protease